MMRCAIASAVLVLASTAPALASCPIVPDGADSRYVENATAHALCLQRQLASETDWRADLARIEANLEAMRVELERQRQQALAATRASMQ